MALVDVIARATFFKRIYLPDDIARQHMLPGPDDQRDAGVGLCRNLAYLWAFWAALIGSARVAQTD